MMRPLITWFFTAVLAGCGSASSTATVPPREPAPSAPPTSAAQPAENEPTPAVEASKPVDSPPPAVVEQAEPARDPKAGLLATETAAFEAAKPVFETYCATCHTKAGKKAAKKKLDHFAMDTYPFGGHHAAAIGFTIRDVLGISGKKPTMPYGKPGSVKGDELAVIKAWTDAWEAAEKGGAHPAAAGHHH